MLLKIHYHSDCSYFGGADNMLATFFASEELRRKYEITFSYRFSQRYMQDLKQKVSIDFPIYPLHFPEIYDFYLLPKRLPMLIRRIIFFAQRILCVLPLLLYEIWVFYCLMKKIKPDVAHINNGGYPGAFSARTAAIAAKIAGVPTVVMVVNNIAVGYNLFFRWLDYPVDRAVDLSVDKFVTGSVAASESLINELNIPEAKCTSIHHGIDHCPATSTAEETRHILGLNGFEGVIFGIVGVLGPRKGHIVLFNAAKKILELGKDGMPKFKIVIVGDGLIRSDLEEYARDKGLSEHCIFVGEREDVMNYMAILDVLVLPSIEREDFPFVVLEAMSHGKPVIASKVAGTVEQVVHQKTGFLVDPGDTAQLVSAMCKIASSNELRKQMGAAGYDYFLDHFTSEISVSRYLSLYLSLPEHQIETIN